MKNLYFNDFEDLACSVSDTYASLKDEGFDDIAIIAKYEEAKHIIKNLLCIGYDVHSIEIHDYLWDNYDAEFVISLYDNKVWCEPFLRENGYINEESPVIYILDNCSSKVIPHCKGKNVYEVSVGIGEDNCNNHSECACKKDEKPTTASKESYFINGKSVDKSEFDKKYEEFEEMYLDNIRDMLLNYCSFMDEVNEWRRRMLRW